MAFQTSKLRFYLIVPFLALLAVVQATIVARFTFSAKPDLLLLVVIGWGATSATRDAYAWGLIGGMWLDVFSGFPFGVQTAALGAMGALANSLETVFFRTNILVPLATIFVATMLYHAVELGILQALGRTVDWTGLITGVILPSALINTALMPFVYGAIRRFTRRAREDLGV